ncbi:MULTISPECIES: FKBP-type peptidyl-prolyl cis-trans isomerase [Robiginitalea]|uniref:peptidylprolyl isomerase n=1 Tax=Robiginitalea biformata (strain ATCC BAA-864 / DSM 15991 / KCTC 12146 / HTCC2501) TaxID=313596 RepID=A4CN74_ROBBH|nr:MULTISPECIES: hypothetical protein [Robiginitalea]EAR15116.1 hypothetical protein RB2501_12337 [Robiginitalea biformata HTCC2501]MDC6353624.1 hypothetical protein [Robiginitalea sp. PM2]MDC6375698.1 hypothetical protein [Robiginitalea sp. SP8]
MTWKKYGLCLLAAAGLIGCSNDDDGGIVEVPPRTLAEVAPEDQAAIQEFLQTHFYNYEEFQNPPADFDYRVVIDTIAGANADKEPLSAQVSSKQISVSADEFGLEDQADVLHTFYYLEARVGGGGPEEAPTVADSVLLTYEGSLLNGESFDGTFVEPIWFDLAGLQGPLSGARGFTEGMPFFKPASSITANPDGTVSAQDAGVGLIIMPSGLGFFNNSAGGIPTYSPLIFTVQVFSVKRTDHDGDGIPSIDEDLDGDGYLYNDNTDEEAERNAFGAFLTVNFLDSDDDGDGTPTREEIIINADGSITYPDSNNNGIPDYLDPDTN